MFAKQLAAKGHSNPAQVPTASHGAHTLATTNPQQAITTTAAMPTSETAATSAAATSATFDHQGPHLVMPVAGRPSSAYGARFDPIKKAEINHPGFDLAAPTGTQVSAAAGGTVTHAGPAGTYGNLVTIRHADGFETRYAHLSSVDVQVGAKVESGQPIGKVGTTGYSTGPHLHFEVRKDGATVDPAPLLPLPLNSSSGRTMR
jgi:murein DD-endopeptidase MepM/ murein hydrolase activator NlpD